MLCRDLEQDANDVILKRTERFGATSPVAVSPQLLFGSGTALCELVLEELGKGYAQGVATAFVASQKCVDPLPHVAGEIRCASDWIGENGLWHGQGG